jgi:hypothetical protein
LRTPSSAIIVSLIALLVAGVLAGCGSSAGSTTTASQAAAATTDPTTKAAEQLATIQEGGTPDASDPLVQQFVSALNDLQPFCSQGPSRLAPEIFNAQQDLEKNNRPATLLRVAQSLDTLVTGVHASTPRTTDCASSLAVYLLAAEAPGGQP